jgi:hypothetical protein
LVIGLLVLAPSRAPTDDAEALLKESLKLVNDMTEILKSVKDKASAEAALPKLKPIDERLAVLKKKEGDLKLSAEEKDQLATKYKAAIETAMKAFGTEVKRVEKLPEVKALLVKELTLFKKAEKLIQELEETKAVAAKVQIKLIDSAIQLYQLNTDQVPKSLKALTEGDKPALKPEALIDPWGKPYQYDPAGPKNKGKKPDVWTVTPGKKVIGNWEEEKQK